MNLVEGCGGHSHTLSAVLARLGMKAAALAWPEVA